MTVLRCLERNPLRAGLVTRAEDWRWSSLRWHLQPPQLPFLDAGPFPRPADWAAWVNAPQTEAELAAVRRCVQRGSPFGTEAWVVPTAARLGLEFTLRARGRPRKPKSPTSHENAPPWLFDWRSGGQKE